MIGQTLSHYKISEEISRGGMGIVYRALDVKLNREVALKVLPPELVSDDERKERFVREAQAAAALKHPNIAVVHEIDEIEGTTFIAMELIEGDTLSQVMAKGVLPVSQALTWAGEIADGLAGAHDKGIVHRDLKPGNIMITDDGHVKIIDFGLAKLTEPRRAGDSDADTALQAKTEAGKVMGTVSYMSPEQARGQSVDRRSDIFSFGIILYEMLTGQVPFHGGDQLAIWSAIADKDPPPMKGVAADLERVVRRMLAKRVDERFQTAADLLAELKVLKRQSDSDITVEGSAPATSKRAATKLALAGGAVVAILSIATLLIDRSPNPVTFSVDSTRQLTFDPGAELHPSLSPDGTLVAYASGPGRRRRLYVRQIDGERTIPLTEEFPGSHGWPQWSPDGARIAFHSHAAVNAAAVYVVPSLGGTPRKIADGLSPTWSSDGEKIAFVNGGDILVHSFETGEATTVGSIGDVGRSGLPHSLRWSPDERWITFVERNIGFVMADVIGNVQPTSVWALSVADGHIVRILEADAMVMSPVWTPDGGSILYVSDQGGSRDVYSLAVEPETESVGTPTRITTGLNPHTIDLSADGARLAYSVYVPRSNAWSVPIGEEEPSTSADAEPITTGNEYIEGVVASPDGGWLGFDSLRSGTQQIYKAPIDGGPPQQLTSGPGDKFLYSWSAGRDTLAYHAYIDDEPDIFVVTSDGATVEQVTRDPRHERSPDISSDGNHVVFSVVRTGTPRVLFVASRDTAGTWGPPRQLTSIRSVRGKWSPDGRRILFRGGTTPGDRALFLVDAEGGEPETLLEPNHFPQLATGIWSPDGQTIYFRAFEPGATTFWSIPAAGGTPRMIARLDDSRHITRSGIQFGSDGKKLYFAVLEQETDIAIAELVTTR